MEVALRECKRRTCRYRSRRCASLARHGERVRPYGATKCRTRGDQPRISQTPRDCALVRVFPMCTTSLHLCEAPGGFVECTRDNLVAPGGPWRWLAITLPNGIEPMVNQLPMTQGAFWLRDVLVDDVSADIIRHLTGWESTWSPRTVRSPWTTTTWRRSTRSSFGHNARSARSPFAWEEISWSNFLRITPVHAQHRRRSYASVRGRVHHKAHGKSTHQFGTVSRVPPAQRYGSAGDRSVRDHDRHGVERVNTRRSSNASPRISFDI